MAIVAQPLPHAGCLTQPAISGESDAQHNDAVTTAPAATHSRAGRWLVGAAIVLLAANLRVAVGSLGVVLETVRGDLGMSATIGGVLTTLPVLCFSIFGVGSARSVRRLGLHHAAVIVLVMTGTGLALRSMVHSGGLFLLCSVLALAGAAVGNVILPPLVKAHFPDRIPLMSALYGSALLAGASISSITTVPLSQSLGGWRPGLGLWAGFAVVAVAPWLLMLRRDLHAGPPTVAHIPVRALARSRLAWAMVVVFAAQSAGAFAQFGWFPEILTDSGVSAREAGTMLGVITAVGIPVTLSLPWLISAVGDRAWLPWGFSALTAAGWLGVLLNPDGAPLLWAVLLGLGGGAFTWTLTMIARRTRTTAGTTVLSVVTQGLGYLLAGIGPFGIGALHDLTGSWDVPLMVLIVLSGFIAVFGTIVARPVMLEDTL